MASVIKIKRSNTTNAPGSLKSGELAYSYGAGAQNDNGDRLFFGSGDDGIGNATSIAVIGGKYFTDKLDHVPGVLTASSAIIVDGSSKIDNLKVDNIDLNGNTISSTDTNGNIVLDPNGTGQINLDSATVQVGNNAANATITTQGAGNLTLSTNGGTNSGTIAIAQGADANITITPNGAGKISLDGQLWPNAVGTNGYYLKTDNTGVLEWAAIPSGSFTVAAESGSNASFTTGNTITFAAGEGIDTTVSVSGADVSVTIAGEDATSSNKGIASFNSTNFTVSSGAVTINDEYVQDTVGAMVSGTGADQTNISVTYDDTNGKLDFSVATATDSVLGVASFSSSNFTVSSGAVTTKDITIGTSTVTNGGTLSSIAGLGQLTVDNIDINGNTISSTNANGNITLDPNGSGSVDVSGAKITNLGAPSQSTDAATKGYVDAVKTGLDVKDSVRLATTAELNATYDNGTGNDGVGATLTNAGTQAVLQLDGVNAVAGNRVLVKNQVSNPEWNGIYTVTDIGSGSTNWVLTRATDFDNSPNGEVTPGAFTFVEEGNTQADNGYVVSTNGTITVGSTGIVWAQFSGAGQITAGLGLSKTGNTLDVNVDGSTIEINSDTLRVKDAGITYAKIQNVTGLSVVGRSASTDGVSAAITATAAYQVLRAASDGASIGFGALDLSQSAAVGTSVLGEANGGTGESTYARGDLLVGNAGGGLTKLALNSTAGKILQSDGTDLVYGDIDGGTY